MTRIRFTGNPPPKCQRCGVTIKRNLHEAVTKWKLRKFCSVECTQAAHRKEGQHVGAHPQHQA